MGSRVKSDRRSFIAQAVIPVRALFSRLSYVILLCVSVAIIIIGRSDRVAMENFRAQVVDALVPLFQIVASPIKAWDNLKTGTGQIMFVYEQNQNLRNENARLQHIQALAEKLEIENRRLRELLHFVSETPVSYIASRIVTDTSGPFTKSAIITAGKQAGITKGQVVINDKGLVGRVLEVGDNSARILLITDINSRIPVITGISGERGILAGNNSDTLTLMHLPLDSNVAAGERIVTSGDGQFFPPGIPVGIVESVTDKSVIITPFVDWAHLEYVSIANYLANQ